ncbi:MAG: hypothetical protein K2W96_10020 [Gemmataceae bacterium]|nr:hypothetical protein [Gemmataceae bacterium]
MSRFVPLLALAALAHAAPVPFKEKVGALWRTEWADALASCSDTSVRADGDTLTR